MRFLIVDDVTDSADSLALCLSLAGHDVRTAGDGGAALALMGSWHPDAVVLDLMLPCINGWEMLDSKARIPTLAGIPVVVLSGYTELPQPLDPAQVRWVFAKPADPARVLSVLESVTAKPEG
jgi:CheY-like chemotaxis protein